MPAPPSDTSIVTARIPTRDLERLKKHAEGEYRSISQEIRRLIHQHLEAVDGDTPDTKDAA